MGTWAPRGKRVWGLVLWLQSCCLCSQKMRFCLELCIRRLKSVENFYFCSNAVCHAIFEMYLIGDPSLYVEECGSSLAGSRSRQWSIRIFCRTVGSRKSVWEPSVVAAMRFPFIWPHHCESMAPVRLAALHQTWWWKTYPKHCRTMTSSRAQTVEWAEQSSITI